MIAEIYIDGSYVTALQLDIRLERGDRLVVPDHRRSTPGGRAVGIGVEVERVVFDLHRSTMVVETRVSDD